jgi:hypothetical protein
MNETGPTAHAPAVRRVLPSFPRPKHSEAPPQKSRMLMRLFCSCEGALMHVKNESPREYESRGLRRSSFASCACLAPVKETLLTRRPIQLVHSERALIARVVDIVQ